MEMLRCVMCDFCFIPDRLSKPVLLSTALGNKSNGVYSAQGGTQLELCRVWVRLACLRLGETKISSQRSV